MQLLNTFIILFFFVDVKSKASTTQLHILRDKKRAENCLDFNLNFSTFTTTLSFLRMLKNIIRF